MIVLCSECSIIGVKTGRGLCGPDPIAELTEIRKLPVGVLSVAQYRFRATSHGDHKMYYQAVERAWGQTNEHTRPASQFVRLARQPVVAGSKKARAVHKRSDPIFTPSVLDENATVGRLSGKIQVRSVKKSDERGISRGAGRVCAE